LPARPATGKTNEKPESHVTNKIAIGLALVILGVFVADQIWFGGEMPVFLGKKFLTLSEYIAFWR